MESGSALNFIHLLYKLDGLVIIQYCLNIIKYVFAFKQNYLNVEHNSKNILFCFCFFNVAPALKILIRLNVNFNQILKRIKQQPIQVKTVERIAIPILEALPVQIVDPIMANQAHLAIVTVGRLVIRMVCKTLYSFAF